jgi:hypothetical protein
MGTRRVGLGHEVAIGVARVNAPTGTPWSVPAGVHSRRRDTVTITTTQLPDELLGYAHPGLAWKSGGAHDGHTILWQSAGKWVAQIVHTADGGVGLRPQAAVFLAWAFALAGGDAVKVGGAATAVTVPVAPTPWLVSRGSGSQWPHTQLQDELKHLYGPAIAGVIWRACRVPEEQRPFISWRQLVNRPGARAPAPAFSRWLKAISLVDVARYFHAVATATDIVVTAPAPGLRLCYDPLRALAMTTDGYQHTALRAAWAALHAPSTPGGRLAEARVEAWKTCSRRRRETALQSDLVQWGRATVARRDDAHLALSDAAPLWTLPFVIGPRGNALTYEFFGVLQLLVRGELEITIAPGLTADNHDGLPCIERIASPTARAPAASVAIVAKDPGAVTYTAVLAAAGRGVTHLTVHFDLFAAMRCPNVLNDLVVAGHKCTLFHLAANNYTRDSVRWCLLGPPVRDARIAAAIGYSKAVATGTDLASAVTLVRAVAEKPVALPSLPLADAIAWARDHPVGRVFPGAKRSAPC